MKKLLVLLVISLVFVGCRSSEDSNDVNQDKIYTDYELFYNANDDVTHAIARFRFGNPLGTILQLKESSGASVTYNGDTLAYSSLWGGHHKQYAGSLTSGTFIYTNTEGTVYTNNVPLGSSIAFPADFTEIDKSAAQSLVWVGVPLAANDQVGVFVGTWTWGDDALFWTDADNDTYVVMGVNQMKNLALGSATVYMDRWNGVDVSEGTSEGGRIRYKYRANNAQVTVVDNTPVTP